MSLKALFEPRGIVVAGSVSPGKLGSVLIDRLLDGGYQNIFVVNPKGQGYGDIPGFVSAGQISAPVDLVVIVSPSFTVASVLEDCGKAGVKAAVIITSGFAEVGNKDGEAEIIAVAKKYGIRFIGPNCAGMANTDFNLYATLEEKPLPGGISVLSQSGAVGGAVMVASKERGIGISKFLSFGNGSDLEVLELLAYLRDDADTNAIVLYIENIKDGRAFMDVLKSTTAKKPVIVIKSGRTSSGQRATLSHTGSLSGSDQVYSAALAQCGALRVRTLEDAYDLCQGFAVLPQPQGDKVVIVTNSGGPGVMAADQADDEGLAVLEASPALKEELGTFLSPYAGKGNPIDITVEGTGEQYRRALVTALADYDSALAFYIGTPYLKAMPIAEGIVSAAKETGKPIIASLMVGSDMAEALAYLKANNIMYLPDGERAMKVFAKMVQYQTYLADKNEMVAPVAVKANLPGMILEPDAMDLLKENGLPVPAFRFITEKGQLQAAAAEIGYPVVMKVVSPQIIHKSDAKGVYLNLQNIAEVEAAYDTMAAAFADKDFRGVMLYPMVPAGKEIMVGFHQDPQFGPVVLAGLGGIYTEILKDVALAVAPVTPEKAKAMLKTLKCYPLLTGVRGERAIDIAGLAQLIADFSQLPFAYPDLQEADLNPVFADENGVAIVDVRLIRK
ncbi:MAG: acetate--CoA ligase family protein [Peptococcaceae bacterium]|nr:acetate--CoA ligase family protein [Peptococcaceae bacterium]